MSSDDIMLECVETLAEPVEVTPAAKLASEIMTHECWRSAPAGWLGWITRREVANLREADLRGADLRWTDLREADLREADLREANLRGAHLGGAHLGGTDLYRADLRGHDLADLRARGAIVEEEEDE